MVPNPIALWGGGGVTGIPEMIGQLNKNPEVGHEHRMTSVTLVQAGALF